MTLKNKNKLLTFLYFFFVFILFNFSVNKPTGDLNKLRNNLSKRIISPDNDSVGVGVNIDFIADFDIITAQAGKHIAFPDIAKDDNDSIVLVYRLGEQHYIDTTGQIMLLKGSPNGLNWGLPKSVVKTPFVDDRDASITYLGNGKIMLNFFKYRYGTNYQFTSPALYQTFVAFSEDNGNSFNRQIQVSNGYVIPYNGYSARWNMWVDNDSVPMNVSACSGAATLSDGSNTDRYIFPSYGGKALLRMPPAYNIVTPKSRISLNETFDNGTTWTSRVINENIDTDSWLSEPDMIDLGNGKYIIHLRSAYGSSPANTGFMRQTMSVDSGQTWTPYSLFNFVGHAPKLFKMKSGLLISAFRMLNNNMSLQKTALMYSLDEGDNWSEPIDLTIFQGLETGYPSIVELNDNKLLVVYYKPGGTGIAAFILKMNIIFEPIDINNTYNELANINKTKVFPNPSNGVFTFSTNCFNPTEKVLLTVSNLQGKVIYTKEDFLDNNNLKIDLTELNLVKGLYLVSLTNYRVSSSARVVVN